MARLSAGLLLYRRHEDVWQVLLAHPGGPLFARRDQGVWTIPKGEPEAGEDLFSAARREFEEETGIVPRGTFFELQPIKQKGGKIVQAWALEQDCDPASVVSNSFRLEWPPKSGRWAEFPEIDRAAFFDLPTARKKIKTGQDGLLEQLAKLLGI